MTRKKVLQFFDWLEDRLRGALSRHPVLYTIIGSVAVVLFYRGVWLTADMISFLTGPVSLIASFAILLAIGLFVSFFIGDQIIISGLKGEKKITEKTEAEVRSEAALLAEVKRELAEIRTLLKEIKRAQ